MGGTGAYRELEEETVVGCPEPEIEIRYSRS